MIKEHKSPCFAVMHPPYLSEEPSPKYPPYIGITDQGTPVGAYRENGRTEPVTVPIRAIDSIKTSHEWNGYIKIQKPTDLHLRADADTTLELVIPYLEYTLQTPLTGSLSTVTGVIRLEPGYYHCRVTHQHDPALRPAL